MSEQPNPGDTIKITGTFDINLNLPPDIKIFVEAVENLPQQIESFRIEGDGPIPLDLAVSTEVDFVADFIDAPEDTVITWSSDDSAAELIRDDGLGNATFRFINELPPAEITQNIDITATATSASANQTVGSVITVEKQNTLGDIGELSFELNGDDTNFSIANGGIVALQVLNDGAAPAPQLFYEWTLSETPSLNPPGTDETSPGSNVFIGQGVNTLGTQFSGTNDTEVLVTVRITSDRVSDGERSLSQVITIGDGSSGGVLQSIGDVTVAVDGGVTEVDNFSTVGFTASYSGNVPSATYSWSCSDPFAIITDNGDGTADVQFQSVDGIYQVNCEVTSTLASDSPQQGGVGLTVGTPGGYVPVEGSLLEAGSGWVADTVAPPALGNPNDVGHEYPAIARWTTKELEAHSNGDGIISHYVIADHRSGIAHVDFSLDNGTFVRVTETTYVPYYDADLYVISVDTDQLPNKDMYEIRAIAVPNSGQPRVLQGPLEHNNPPADENGEKHWSPVKRGMFGMFFSKIDSSERKVAFVDNVNGIDDVSLADGTQEKPYKTPVFAIFNGLCNSVNYTEVSHWGLELLPSTQPYTFDGMAWPKSSTSNRRGWFTIASADPANPVTITAKAVNSSGSLSQNMTMLRFKDINFNYVGLESGKVICSGAQGSHLLVENCTFESEQSSGAVFGGFAGWTGYFDCHCEDSVWGPYGKGTAVNCSIYGLTHDAFRTMCGFNLSVEYFGKFVPGYNPLNHCDVFQIYYAGGIVENCVMHGLTATERCAAQGMYFSGHTVEFRNFLVKNCKVDIRDSTDGVPNPNGVQGGLLHNWYVYTDTKHFVLRNCEFNEGYIGSGATSPPPYGDQIPDEGYFSGEASLWENVTKMNTVEPMFPYPDRRGGNGLGDFYVKAGSPPLPWTSPSTLIEYRSDAFVDYLQEVRIVEGNVVVSDSNEITPATKTLRAAAITDQDDIVYAWSVTASDGDLSLVTNTSGTDENFVFEVTAGNNDRVYTVTAQATSPTLGITVVKSVTYKVRPPVAFPVEFEGIIPDSGGNFYNLYSDALQPGDTWVDANGENVMPGSWLQLQLRSYKRGMTLYFSSEEEMIDRFLGEYAGKNITLNFGDATASLNGPIQVGTIGDPGVTCETGTNSDDGSSFIRFPNDGDDSVWDNFPGTISKGPKPFKLTFTNP